MTIGNDLICPPSQAANTTGFIYIPVYSGGATPGTPSNLSAGIIPMYLDTSVTPPVLRVYVSRAWRAIA